MRKFLVLFLVLMMTFTLAACGEKNNGDQLSQGSSSEEISSTATGQSEKQAEKVYGIGEAAEANGLSITIDKVEAAEPNSVLEQAKGEFVYLKVWFTFKNISDGPIVSPDRKDFYIVYEEGPTGDDCDMTSDKNSQVMLEVADRGERYMSEIELAPGESTGGWMIYQRQADKGEITMHYYSGYVNVAPDLVFRFMAE